MSAPGSGPGQGEATPVDRRTSLDDARRDLARLRQALTTRIGAGAVDEDARASLRAEITALIRLADAQAQEWREFADAARALPDLWKKLSVDGHARVPTAGAAMPATHDPDAGSTNGPVVARSGGSSRSDHLGASTYVAKGWSAYAAADYAAAEAAFTRALGLAPDYAEASALQAWARASLGQDDEALLAAQRVLVSRPGGTASSLARVAIGRVCLAKGIAGEAIEHLARVVRDDDDRRATLYATLGLGVAYASRGMRDDAVAYFRRALALGPNLVEARYELGEALHASGALAEARAEWALGAGAGRGPWARRCAERLQNTEGPAGADAG